MFRRCTIITIISAILIFLLVGCSSDHKTDKANIIAKINDFQLTKNEFQKKFIKEMEYSNTYKTTSEAKNKFLQTIIKKELLIQEAKKQGIDKKKEFMSAIERYWEATLIKHLMETKSREILQTTSVSENQIKQKYQELKSQKIKSNHKDIPTFNEVEKDIAKELLSLKKTQALNRWTQSLYDKADITIDSGFITE